MLCANREKSDFFSLLFLDNHFFFQYTWILKAIESDVILLENLGSGLVRHFYHFS
jgi:hypothetical protein